MKDKILNTILIFVLLIMFYVVCFYSFSPSNNSGNDDNNGYEKTVIKEDIAINKNFVLSGYSDMQLTKDTAVALENNPQNEDFLVTYEIINLANNESVFKTDYIMAGQEIIWCPGEYLETGTHNLNFKQEIYYVIDNRTPIFVTASNNELVFQIIDNYDTV